MVLLVLVVDADLENLTNLRPEDDFIFHIKVKCSSCQEESEKESTLTSAELYNIPNSRGSAHLVQKCRFCGRTGTITLVEGKGRPLTADDSKQVTIACFDCRGMEPVAFFPSDGWLAEGHESGTKFDVDLSDGEFVDYDEKAGESVGLYEFKSRFEVTR